MIVDKGTDISFEEVDNGLWREGLVDFNIYLGNSDSPVESIDRLPLKVLGEDLEIISFSIFPKIESLVPKLKIHLHHTSSRITDHDGTIHWPKPDDPS